MRRSGALLGLAIIGMVCVGCGDSGPDLRRFARISTTPADRDVRLEVGVVPIGAREVYALTIRNTGEENLEVRDVRLVYGPPVGVSEDQPAFQVGFPAGVDLSVRSVWLRPVGSSGDLSDALNLEVVFTHWDRTPRTAKLIIESSSKEDRELELVFTTTEGVPVVGTAPATLDFGIVQHDVEAEMGLTVINSGNAVLEFQGIQMAGDRGFTFVDPHAGWEFPLSVRTENGVVFDEPHAIEPNGSLTFPVRYHAESDRGAEGQLVLMTNDVSLGAGYPIRMLANQKLPIGRVDPESIDFSYSAIGTTRVRSLRVYSSGLAPLEIYELSFDDGSSRDFEIDLSGVPSAPEGGVTDASPIVVPMNEFADIAVTYTPDMEVRDLDGELVSDTGTLIVRTNAYVGRTEVPTWGTGVVAECPLAEATLAEGEEIIPQTVVHLGSAGSHSSCGQVDGWRWSVTQPEGAAGTFLPSATFHSPTFSCDVAGTYEFCLRVTDSCGACESEPSCVEVQVIPDEVLHIELLWSTAGDPDPFDSGPQSGADMDLHFMHPYALIGGEDIDGDLAPDGWFNQTYDCFWANPHPDWGSFDPAANDDPGLDRDDTDGWGPENVNIDAPEDLSTLPVDLLGRRGVVGEPLYRVGVHYWNDHGFGPSLATLRVYIRGELVYEKSGTHLLPGDMWSALTIGWPSGDVTELHDGSGELRIHPDYEHPSFIAP